MMRDRKPQIREGVFVLDWLARNLHEWPAVTPKIIPSGDDVFEHGANFCGDYVEIIGCIGLYAKDKWIRRRRELGLEVCEMSDLDWLARNVHEWPYEIQNHCYVITDRDGKKSISACAYSPFFSKFTKDEWLARRAELQNKPSWDTSPKWARSLFQNFDGRWFWVEFSTDKNGDSFWTLALGSSGKQKYASSGEVLGDWRDTLEKRPADLPERAVTGRLKEATDNVLAAAPELMTDKFKFEPFVSVEDAATAKQPAPKGSGNPILGMVLADLTNRALEGKEKYGEPLLAHNGRNPLWDAYQEALDLAMYLRQAIEEQK